MHLSDAGPKWHLAVAVAVVGADGFARKLACRFLFNEAVLGLWDKGTEHVEFQRVVNGKRDILW